MNSLATARKKKKKPKSFLRLGIEQCVPNDWNMNRMIGEPFEKLKKGIQLLLDKDKAIPPITVRPHPTRKDHYEIIDGYHRLKAIKQLGQKKVGAFVLDVPTDTAIMLTNNLNYLRGEQDKSKYVDALYRLRREFEMPLLELTKVMPEDEQELVDLLEQVETAKAIDLLGDLHSEQVGREQTEAKDPEVWVEMKFVVALGQARIIEAELSRIEEQLRGSNRRSRALEYMAVLSGQTPVELSEPEPEKKKKKKKRKKKDKRSVVPV